MFDNCDEIDASLHMLGKTAIAQVRYIEIQPETINIVARL